MEVYRKTVMHLLPPALTPALMHNSGGSATMLFKGF